MQYTDRYESPIGSILLAADELGLTGLWFEGQKYFPTDLCQTTDSRSGSAKHPAIRKLPVFTQAETWLNIYFSGKNPDFELPLHFTGTAFQNEVWSILCTIPYGQTMTYGEIAGLLAEKRRLRHMSAQAVGGAVGHNPISIIIPCHRVVGAKGNLTGYAGGIDKKIYLLRLEGAYQESQGNAISISL